MTLCVCSPSLVGWAGSTFHTASRCLVRLGQQRSSLVGRYTSVAGPKLPSTASITLQALLVWSYGTITADVLIHLEKS